MKHARLFQNILGIPRMIKKPGNFGKSRAFWKKPYFFFKRLKLDSLKKRRAFSKQALLFPENARLFRLKLRTQKNVGLQRKLRQCFLKRTLTITLPSM
jgi:hypothetical protein